MSRLRPAVPALAPRAALQRRAGRISVILSAVLIAVVASLPRYAAGQALTTLHIFTGGADGGSPSALIQASDGNLYGTAFGGGLYNDGCVFSLNLGGTLSALYSFNPQTDGIHPIAPLLQAADGNLYGTTDGGYTLSMGTIFELTLGGAFNTLYYFGGAEGSYDSFGKLAQAPDGTLYGTTAFNGTGPGPIGLGTIYTFSAGAGFNTLYSFQGNPDGAYPEAGVIFASDGNMYGTSAGGGANSNGAIFKSDTSGAARVIYSFTGSSDGRGPSAPLLQASDGNLYGMATYGGLGHGTLFRITTAGNLTPVYSFTGGADGAQPLGGLMQASDGNLYGTTSSGGAHNLGTIFQLSASGTVSTLWSFSGADGSYPSATLVQATDGNLYGVTGNGATYGEGTVFRFTLPASVAKLTINHGTVTGSLSAQGTATLSAAVSADTLVTLSSNSTAAQPPATVTVTAGNNSATFAIPTTAVSSLTRATITATLGSSSISAPLLVEPVSVKSLTISPNSVTGGTSAIGTVTLTAPAPAGGIHVHLLSHHPAAAAPASASLFIPAGSQTGTFTINTSVVSSPTSAEIEAGVNGGHASAKITVN